MTKRDLALRKFENLSAAVNAKNKVASTKAFGELCDALGWGSAQFSEKFGISDQSYYRWLKGDAVPRNANLVKIEQFLKVGDLDWSGPRVDPVEMGIHTWKHMENRASDPNIHEIWIFSVVDFLEGKIPEAGIAMAKIVKETAATFNYVFPDDSSAQVTWRRWRKLNLKGNPESAKGRVVGYTVSSGVSDFPMFGYGVYFLIYRYKSRDRTSEGFVAFPPKQTARDLLSSPDELNDRLSDLIWIQVKDELSDGWYSDFCRNLQESRQREKKPDGVDTIACEHKFSMN
ncbi:MAG: helix-turn-helix transcriptional regulator [Pyrinomonadaceae bacterium]